MVIVATAATAGLGVAREIFAEATFSPFLLGSVVSGRKIPTHR